MFSVVIPTFNREKLLERALNSVIEQSEKGFEIIVVDNVSTDNTKTIVSQIIAKHKRFKIRYIYQENSGSPAGAVTPRLITRVWNGYHF